MISFSTQYYYMKLVLECHKTIKSSSAWLHGDTFLGSRSQKLLLFLDKMLIFTFPLFCNVITFYIYVSHIGAYLCNYIFKILALWQIKEEPTSVQELPLSWSHLHPPAVKSPSWPLLALYTPAGTYPMLLWTIESATWG